ncbi:MAG: protein translocase subunit SecF [Chloroflexota bacterium]|nr:protein translocase subunit SecF [Chloroflexota bacterium]MDE3192739.1 protein translocase subunit SecF [Chloroflexota bacterium]
MSRETRTALFRVVERKWLYFLLSGLLIVPGIAFLLLGGLKPGIEFLGGTLLDVRFSDVPAATAVHDVMTSLGHSEAQLQGAEGSRLLIRTKEMKPVEVATTQQALEKAFPGKILGVDASSVSPSFSGELVQNAIRSIVFASILIVLLIAFAFRTFGWAAFRYGIAAIVALLHDAFLVLGLFAMLGYFLGVEVDSLFVTAVLTIIGFSVHDTIVVFDRIRENLRLNPGEALNPVINFSVMQTMTRSVITSLTVLLTLLALFLFGGYSVRNFALALLIGIISGTYSSIFNAAQVVSLWQEIEDVWRRRGKAQPAAA